jgi:hypothetical protein
VAPTNGCGSFPVVRCTLHMSPDKWVDEPPGVPTLASPAERGCAGEGAADGGPALLGVMISLVSSSSCLLGLAVVL